MVFDTYRGKVVLFGGYCCGGQAQAALGAKYNLKAFDDTVVGGGNVPLDVLAKNVDEYIRTTKG